MPKGERADVLPAKALGFDFATAAKGEGPVAAKEAKPDAANAFCDVTGVSFAGEADLLGDSECFVTAAGSRVGNNVVAKEGSCAAY